MIDAEQAVHDPRSDDWVLRDVSIYDSTMSLVRKLPEMRALAGVTPQQLTLARVDPEELDFAP